MAEDVLAEIREQLSGEATGRLQYTRRAFHMLPVLDRPRILDVGCGSGGPTLELARLSRGQVVGLDIQRGSLQVLVSKAREVGLSERVMAVNGTMREMGFPNGSFDVLWAEGAIFAIGFQRGLREWRPLLRPGGFLVVHDMVWLRPHPPPDVYGYWKARYPEIGTVPESLKRIPACGYELVGHFALPEEAWWNEYYGPLEARVGELRGRYAGDAEALAVLEGEQREIDWFKRCQGWYGSAFFVMQRRGAGDGVEAQAR